MAKRFIYGNWKMAQTRASADSFFKAFDLHSIKDQLELGVFPSFPYLEETALKARQLAVPMKVGAQDCSDQKSGAFTGEVSAETIRECQATHVLIGHSERRQRAKETNETLSRKLARAFEADLFPTFCIGETESERDSGKVEEVLNAQLLVADGLQKPFVIAYEPVWAIGTGRTPTLHEINKTHSYILDRMSKNSHLHGVLYGGSVKPQNAAEILSMGTVAGLLVGGASLKGADFKAIVEAALAS